MRSLLITGSDTGIGKTRVTGALAGLLSSREGNRVQIVKVVETGQLDATSGDAAEAHRISRHPVPYFTLRSLEKPIAPAAAAEAARITLTLEGLVSSLNKLPPADWRLLEGAGGIATPVDNSARDWVDFAIAAHVDAVVVVVPDRLGAINQARLAVARARQSGVPTGVCLNTVCTVGSAVAASTRSGLKEAGIPVWAELGHNESTFNEEDSLLNQLTGIYHLPDATVQPTESVAPDSLHKRFEQALFDREERGRRRVLKTCPQISERINLADNDYLELNGDPAIATAVALAASSYGTSASASPLVTGWKEPHAALVNKLCSWHGFSSGLLWSSGYAANSAVLGSLPEDQDLIFADRLIHHSMVTGILRSGCAFRRFGHLDLNRLETFLQQAEWKGRPVFVATETVFSMDGDYPDLRAMASLKRKYGFFWIVDEAHGIGWYGPEGSGLARETGVEKEIDILVGTLGKTLASGGAYTLFHDDSVRQVLINKAGEFIYSTALPPTNAVAAETAIDRVRSLSWEQSRWKAASTRLRSRLRECGWDVPEGDSPIVPIILNRPDAAVSLAGYLQQHHIDTASIRPPTVPEGTSRLRLSLKRSFTDETAVKVINAMNTWRAAG